ncbi:beta-galactosidase [Flavobacterium algicola]|uniref:beta-galactosidase n=1 Tax=Flavobacterium algicola TaxID=556529 RepID=UPI001EFEDEC4|nr:beta-galactosidase [Flavobacterium algicola]MCG9793733.1 beta-galactosidase [Flavobacterium algicola]
MKHSKLISLLFILGMIGTSFAQDFEKDAQAKIKTLNGLIAKVEKQGKDVLKEKMTVRTAEVFLDFANWDAKNIEQNTNLFKMTTPYRNNAAQMAQDLPNFERADVVKMLDEAIAYITLLKEGKVIRKPAPNIEWDKVIIEKDQITYNKRPVFLADYTWKPDVPILTEFFGNKGGHYISPKQVLDEKGTIQHSVIKDLDTKNDKRPWFVFIDSGHMPDWFSGKVGTEATQLMGGPFYHYDIDQQGTKEIISNLFKETVSRMAGKKYNALGYMLANEPRWITYKDSTKKVWYNSSVGENTIEKFKVWLQNKHHSIANLNQLWKTNFSSFDTVKLDIPIDIALVGTAQWYDWNTFNDQRVVDWFTWMKGELRKNDPKAKSHLKIMPSFFTDNDPCTGIDLERLTELSEINGNDCAAHYNNTKKEKEGWQDNYVFGWRELFLGYDFLKSVRPNQINFNTESHLLSTGHTRDLYMNPKYVRAAYWAAHTLGMNASQTWYWPRKADGSLKENFKDNAYGGSNNQQPRVTNELHSTMMDLNTYSEEIMAMQRQAKPIRIFYSVTSAHNKRDYMDDLFKLYESLNFEGVPLGFATKKILEQQNHSNWDVVLVRKTERVTQDELKQIQSYLDKGGVVLVDDVSLKSNEYGVSLPALKESKGKLIVVNAIAEMKSKALSIVEQKKHLPEVLIVEENGTSLKGCTWKCVKNEKGNNVLSIINMGKNEAKLTIKLKKAKNGTSCYDLINGIAVSSQPILKPNEVLFVELKDKK